MSDHGEIPLPAKKVILESMGLHADSVETVTIRACTKDGLLHCTSATCPGEVVGGEVKCAECKPGR